jgi:hypothetical protein
MCETVFENEITRVAAIGKPVSSNEQDKKVKDQYESHVIYTSVSPTKNPFAKDDISVECDVTTSICTK